jgi:biopolymer transport protein ExbD
MSRQQPKSEGAAPINLGLIITPMLDMSFQLLAFFIMTYHPSALEGHIPGSLVPPDNIMKKGPKDPNVPAPVEDPLSVKEEDLDPALKESMIVRLKSIAKGQEFSHLLEGRIDRISIRPPVEENDKVIAEVRVSGTLGFTDEALDKEYRREVRKAMDTLDTKLKELAKQGVVKKAHIKLEADNDMRQEYFMMAYDTCKRAGFDKIHFVPPPLLKSKLKY